MELNNNGSISASTIRQRQQEQLQKNQQEQQQQHNEYQQQFCLRWHNHQVGAREFLIKLKKKNE